MAYSKCNCLNVSFSGLITSAIDYSLLCGSCSEGFQHHIGALERLCHLIVALHGPSI